MRRNLKARTADWWAGLHPKRQSILAGLLMGAICMLVFLALGAALTGIVAGLALLLL